MEDHLLSLNEVVEITHRSRATIYRDLRAGRFPRPIELGANAIAWKQSEIQAWLDSRPRRNYGAPTQEAA
jgi:prophage regulatory protein